MMLNKSSLSALFSKHRTKQANSSGIEITLDELLQLRLNVGKTPLRARKRVVASRADNQRSRALGRGLDFADLRAYQAGDDVRMIDWNVTARTQQVHTKLFEEEKERPVFLCVDFCSPMLFGTRVALKSVTAARLAAQLAWLLSGMGERVGGIVFGDQRHTEIKPVKGTRGALRLLKSLVDLHAESIATYGSSSQHNPAAFGAALRRLRTLAHPGSLIIFISDFSGLSANDEHWLSWLTTHVECIAARVVDPLEEKLPKRGVYSVTNGMQRGEFDAASSAIREVHHDEFIARDVLLSNFFGHRGNYYGSVNATQPVIDAARHLLLRRPLGNDSGSGVAL